MYKTNDDHVTVIGAGVTLHEALAAADQLKKGAHRQSSPCLIVERELGFDRSLLAERINIRVIDPFTIKPLDAKTIIDNARVTRGRIITVEDHYYEGEGCGNNKFGECFSEHGHPNLELPPQVLRRTEPIHMVCDVFQNIAQAQNQKKS